MVLVDEGLLLADFPFLLPDVEADPWAFEGAEEPERRRMISK